MMTPPSHRYVFPCSRQRSAPCRFIVVALVAVWLFTPVAAAKPFSHAWPACDNGPRIASRAPGSIAASQDEPLEVIVTPALVSADQSSVVVERDEAEEVPEVPVLDAAPATASPSVDEHVSPAICNGIRAFDEILLVNTRPVGCCCDPAALMSGVRVESYALCGDACCRSWQSVDLASLAAPVDPGVTTVIYVHGNRISSGQDKHRGLFVYRRLARCADGDAPIRFVILSWPAAQIPGPLKDARVKAARTGPVACQLAWLLSQMPADQPIGLIGYSYGARVVTGALHVIAGGHLSGMGAACDCGERAPVNVVLYGAALDADWLAPGHYHGLAMTQVDCMLLLNNRRDRVMRWYPLAAANGKPQALGLAGPTCIGPYGCQISNCDLSRAIGAQHDEHAYLSAPGAASRIWRYATRSVQ